MTHSEATGATTEGSSPGGSGSEKKSVSSSSMASASAVDTGSYSGSSTTWMNFKSISDGNETKTLSAEGGGNLTKDGKTSSWTANANDSVGLFDADFFMNVTGSSDQYQAMRLVRDISDTLEAGKKLNYSNAQVWQQASTAISILVHNPVCHEFTAASPVEPAVCCVVHVLKDDYLFAFCTLQKFLPTSGYQSAVMGIDRTKKMKSSNRLLLTPDTVHINLFEVPCAPMKDDGLCSQYVRFDQFFPSAFCSRKKHFLTVAAN